MIKLLTVRKERVDNMKESSKLKVLDMTYIAVSAVIIAVCSWISIPAPIPFTMQTFAICLVVGTLGGKRGTIAVLIYLLLGALGVPVFAGFTGGLGVLGGVTGGYLVGFILSALLMWGMEKWLGKKTYILGISMVLGLLVCYAFGTAWFMFVYGKNTGPIGLGAALMSCVVPYLIPDCIKIAIALPLSKKLAKILKLN